MAEQSDYSKLVSIVTREVFAAGKSRQEIVTPEFWSLATKHKVASILTPLVCAQQPDTAFAASAKEYWQKTALREEYFWKKSKELEREFGEARIDVALLKGVLVSRAYPKRGWRALRDADILINKEDVPEANRYLLANGYLPLEPQSPLANAAKNKGTSVIAAQKGIDALSFVKDDFFLEVHTVIVPPLLGTYPVEIKGGLSTEDTLAHLLFHATRHHFLFGLRQLLDVAVWIADKKPNMQMLSEKLEKHRLYELAWPSWKLSHETFPEIVPMPPRKTNRFSRLYVSKINRHFENIPTLSIALSGSPLPCLFMLKGTARKFFGLFLKSEATEEYQLGSNVNLFQKLCWQGARPFALLRRHGGLVLRWARLLFS